MEVDCCIVDDHCDIIPFLQCCWRSKRIPFSGIIFVHFDAHADLSIYNTNKVEDFDDVAIINSLLEQEGGISEFILPLVILNHFSQICWVYPDIPTSEDYYPEFCDNQNHLFWIGNSENNSIGVSSHSSYYFEDGVVYDAQELSNCCLVNLAVCKSSSTLKLVHKLLPNRFPVLPLTPQLSKTKIKTSTPWILDICLDYFSVYNPFLIPLIEDLSQNRTTTEVQAVLQIILSMLRHPEFRVPEYPYNKSTHANPCYSRIVSEPSSSDKSTSNLEVNSKFKLARRRLERLLFLEALTLLCNCQCSFSTCNCQWNHSCPSQIFPSNTNPNTPHEANRNETAPECFGNCTTILCPKVINNNKAINKEISSSQIVTRFELESRFTSLYSSSTSQEIAKTFLSLLPSLSCTSRHLIATSNFLLLLPHYPRAMEGPAGVAVMISDLISFCQRLDMGVPVAITIAKSLGYNEINDDNVNVNGNNDDNANKNNHDDNYHDLDPSDADSEKDSSSTYNNNNNNHNSTNNRIQLPGAYTPLHQADQILSLLLTALTSWIESETCSNGGNGNTPAASGSTGKSRTSSTSASFPAYGTPPPGGELAVLGAPPSLLRPLPASVLCLDFIDEILLETPHTGEVDNNNCSSINDDIDGMKVNQSTSVSSISELPQAICGDCVEDEAKHHTSDSNSNFKEDISMHSEYSLRNARGDTRSNKAVSACSSGASASTRNPTIAAADKAVGNKLLVHDFSAAEDVRAAAEEVLLCRRKRYRSL